MNHAFTAATPHEYLSVDVVTRILGCLPSHVMTLIQDGQLQARSVSGEPRISSASLDRYTEQRPVRFSSQPQTFTKINGRIFEELPNGRLIPVDNKLAP